MLSIGLRAPGTAEKKKSEPYYAYHPFARAQRSLSMTTRHRTLKNHAQSGAGAGVRDWPAPLARRSSSWEGPIQLTAIVVLGLCLGLGIIVLLDQFLRSNHPIAMDHPIAMERASGSTGSATVDRIAPSVAASGQTVKDESPPSGRREVTIESEGPSGNPPAQELANIFAEPARVDWLDPEVPAGGLSISGRVQNEKGRPLAGIAVLARAIRLFDADVEATDPAREAVQSASTDFDGYFLFRDIADGEYRIHTTAMDGFAPAQITVRAGVTSANLVLATQREVQIFGVVKSTDGTPLEAVQVINYDVPPLFTETGPQGNYELAASLKTNDQFLPLYFKREGYRNQPVRLDPVDLDDEFDDILLDVSMEPLEGLTAVTGSLKDPNGHPIVGEVVRLQSSGLKTLYRGQSDMNGLFFFGGVEPGADYRLIVTPQGGYRDHVRKRLEIPGKGVTLEVVLEPLRDGAVSGWMMDLYGNPIPGFALFLRSQVAHRQSVLVTGDDDGFFAVEEIPEGRVELSTASLPKITATGIRASSEAEEPVFVVLDLGSLELRGRVTNRSGKPLAAPSVNLAWWHRENGVRSFSARSTAADANGKFSFRGLGPGPHILQVNMPGYSTAKIRIDVGASQSEVIVQLDEEM